MSDERSFTADTRIAYPIAEAPPHTRRSPSRVLAPRAIRVKDRRVSNPGGVMCRDGPWRPARCRAGDRRAREDRRRRRDRQLLRMGLQRLAHALRPALAPARYPARPSSTWCHRALRTPWARPTARCARPCAGIGRDRRPAHGSLRRRLGQGRALLSPDGPRLRAPPRASEVHVLALGGGLFEAEVGALQLLVGELGAPARELDLPAAEHVDPVGVLQRAVGALLHHQ